MDRTLRLKETFHSCNETPYLFSLIIQLFFPSLFASTKGVLFHTTSIINSSLFSVKFQSRVKCFIFRSVRILPDCSVLRIAASMRSYEYDTRATVLIFMALNI